MELLKMRSRCRADAVQSTQLIPNCFRPSLTNNRHDGSIDHGQDDDLSYLASGFDEHPMRAVILFAVVLRKLFSVIGNSAPCAGADIPSMVLEGLHAPFQVE